MRLIIVLAVGHLLGLAVVIGVTYIAMAGVTAFVTWSPVLWHPSDWNQAGRGLLLLFTVFWTFCFLGSFLHERWARTTPGGNRP